MTNMLFSSTDLITFATTLLTKAGIPEERSRIVAETLVEADMMGHTTHGLHLLPAYAQDAVAGKMKHDGDPLVLNDRGSVITWDGQYLPGPWLVHRAIDLAFERVREHPVVCVSIRRSHHIACLAAYPERATRKGLMMLLSSSDPRAKSVAPYGGLEPVFTPNPLAAGIPTEGEPIILDVSMSVTSNGLVLRTLQEGKKLPHPWLLDSSGKVTDDPAEFVKDPPATVLPLGGLDTGYKGFAMAVLVEALTSGLAGHGRADHPDTWGASVFLQVMDPDAFGGRASFEKQNQFLADACINSKPADRASPVRLPGTRALHLRDEQKKNGVRLHPSIPPALEECGKKFGVVMAESINK